MTFSMDLRQRVVAAVQRGEAVAVVARRFDVSRPTVRQWRDRAEQGTLSPEKPGPRRGIKLTEEDDALIRKTIADQPGITAKQLIPLLSQPVVESTVCRRLIKLGLRLKKSR